MANILVVTASYDFLSPVVILDHKTMEIVLSCLQNSY